MIIVAFFITLTSVSQDVKTNIPNENLKILVLNVHNLDKTESEVVLNRNLRAFEGLFFCSFSIENLKSFLVIESNFDINAFSDKLNAYGYGLMEYVISDFDEKEYLLNYLNYRNPEFDKSINSELNFLKTNNYAKDLAAYNKAKDIYLKLNNKN